MPDWSEAAEEPERRHLLEVEPRWVRFRHELARTAIESSLSIAARRRHHGEILRILLELDADPADLVHHADAAGADDLVVGRYALVAARSAAALESNLEAHLYYQRALPFIDGLPPPERAPVLEDVAWTAYAAGRIEDAIAAIRRAIELYESLQNHEALGRSTRMLSRFHWWSGDGRAARERAAHAVAILEPLGETLELARAYSAASQLAALADDAEPALGWGERALALARRLGDERTCAHALVNIGSVELQLDPDAVEALLEAHDVAHAVGDSHEAARALNNLSTRSLWWARPAAALRYAERTVEYAEEHQVHAIGPHSAMLIAWLRLRAGDWIEAKRLAQSEQSRGVVDVVSATVLTELAVRRGDVDAAQRLAELRARTERAAELQRSVAAFELAIESALTSGAPMPTEWIEGLVDQVAPRGPLVGRFAVRIAAWAAVAGLEVDYADPKGGPYTAMQRRDWQGAADAFGEIGWWYDRALMLSLLDDEVSLSAALDIARELGAVPLAARAEGRRRELTGLSSTRP
jgi:tetratricopeptide (TPR) repeat protein